MRRPFFAVLGGMGTLATESYIRLVDQLTHAHTDQEYLDYVVSVLQRGDAGHRKYI